MSTALVSRGERPPAPAGTGARKLTERAFRIRESGIIVVLLVFVAITASIQPRFLDITNIQFILVNTTVFALLALGETMVVISRNYDLSLGSVLGLSAYLSASQFGQHHGLPIVVVFVAITASIQPRFLNITNIQFILVNTTVFALLALGETMVVISRNYDPVSYTHLTLPTTPYV